MSEAEAKAFGKKGQEVTMLFEQLPFPVVACVSGYALGGGCEMAMSADWIYGTRAAVFGQPEVKLGLIPGFGGTQRLTRIVGRNRAREIILTARNIKIDEAFEIGLVQKIFETKDEMIEAATKTLSRLKNNSPNAIAVAKKVTLAGENQDIENALEGELNGFSKIFSSREMQEGTQAFMEKRSPVFNRGED